MSEDLVLIACIGKAHALKGEVEIHSFSWDESRFERLDRVFVKMNDGKIVERNVEFVHHVHKGLLLKFEGIDDRTQAEHLRNSEILIPESERAPLPEGRAYYDQIIGMTVRDDATNRVLGTVTNVLDMPAGDVFVLDLNGNEHLVTNRGEEIKKLDVERKELRVTLLEAYGEKTERSL